MYCMNVWLTVRSPHEVDTVQGLLAEAAELSREEPGCMRFEVYHSQSDVTRFLLIEQWESKDTWEHHRIGGAFPDICRPHVLPLVDCEPHISTLVAS
jgi:quinol monooxygenase YgiN